MQSYLPFSNLPLQSPLTVIGIHRFQFGSGYLWRSVIQPATSCSEEHVGKYHADSGNVNWRHYFGAPLAYLVMLKTI